MKKSIFILSFMLISFISKADQLAFISENQAKEAVEYLKSEKSVILWCACCEDEEREKITITKISYEETRLNGRYQVIIEGVDSEGEEIKEYADLAYVHVKVKHKAVSLGKVLNYRCDPCTEPFSWRKFE